MIIRTLGKLRSVSLAEDSVEQDTDTLENSKKDTAGYG